MANIVCVAGAILFRCFQKMRCIFPGRGSPRPTIFKIHISTVDVFPLETPCLLSSSRLCAPHFTRCATHRCATHFRTYTTIHTLHFRLAFYSLHSGFHTRNSSFHTFRCLLHALRFTLYTSHSSLRIPRFPLHTLRLYAPSVTFTPAYTHTPRSWLHSASHPMLHMPYLPSTPHTRISRLYTLILCAKQYSVV